MLRRNRAPRDQAPLHEKIPSPTYETLVPGYFTRTFIVVYLVLKPFYLWQSGLPQLADAFLLLIIIGEILRTNTIYHPRKSKRVVRYSLVAFVYWTVMVNLVAAILVPDEATFLVASAMNIFNLIVSLVFMRTLDYDFQGVVKCVYAGIVISISIQSVVVVSSSISSDLRSIGSFNNPNQLAFFALLSICLLVTTYDLSNQSLKWTLLGIIAGVVCIIFSLSRAGMLASSIVLVGVVLWPPGDSTRRRSFRFWVLALLVVCIGYFVASETLQNSELMSSISERADREDPEGFETTRGYSRLFDFPQYWIQGAGEGGFGRFGGHANEVHSTLGNIQLSYGLIGVVLFAAIMIFVLRSGNFRNSYVLLAVLMYGFAHNGIRNTLFWMLLVLLALPQSAVDDTFGLDRNLKRK